MGQCIWRNPEEAMVEINEEKSRYREKKEKWVVTIEKWQRLVGGGKISYDRTNSRGL